GISKVRETRPGYKADIPDSNHGDPCQTRLLCHLRFAAGL
ncbi:MAG: hypothetical protein HW416_1996, partial [Chloroflexi bacterium]|nr:hypothetical protein [Chloroflexota bacterium]